VDKSHVLLVARRLRQFPVANALVLSRNALASRLLVLQPNPQRNQWRRCAGGQQKGSVVDNNGSLRLLALPHGLTTGGAKRENRQSDAL